MRAVRYNVPQQEVSKWAAMFNRYEIQEWGAHEWRSSNQVLQVCVCVVVGGCSLFSVKHLMLGSEACIDVKRQPCGHVPIESWSFCIISISYTHRPVGPSFLLLVLQLFLHPSLALVPTFFNSAFVNHNPRNEVPATHQLTVMINWYSVSGETKKSQCSQLDSLMM